jgi:hypothetical protein
VMVTTSAARTSGPAAPRKNAAGFGTGRISQDTTPRGEARHITEGAARRIMAHAAQLVNQSACYPYPQPNVRTREICGSVARHRKKPHTKGHQQ